MRTWYVPLAWLDNQRVLAQHREAHALIGSIRSPNRGYQHHPVTKLYMTTHFGCLLDLHEQTVVEMKERGWTGHLTPLPQELWELASEYGFACMSWHHHAEKQRWIKYPEHGVERDLHELAERWMRENKTPRNDELIGTLWAHATGHTDDPDCGNRIDLLTQGRKIELLDEAGLAFAR